MILLWTSSFPKLSNAEIIDHIVAQVGEKVITFHEVEVFAPSVVRSIYSIADSEKQEEAWNDYFNQTVDFMIYDVTLQTAASRIGITASDEEIQELIIVLQEQNTEFREHVREILDREGSVTPELYLFVKQVILTNKVQSSLSARAIVTEEDVKEYLKNDPNSGYGLAEYNVKLAFFPNDESYGKFESFSKKIPFHEAAAAAGHSAIDMGWVKSADLVPSVRDEVEKMKKGDTSHIKDPAGNIIAIKLEDTRTSAAISEGMRNAATYALKEKQRETIFNRWLERQKQSIVVYRFK